MAVLDAQATLRHSASITWPAIIYQVLCPEKLTAL